MKGGTLRALGVLLTLALAGGCKAQAPEAEHRPLPTADELHRASAPGYTAPAGVRQECIGRQVFDAPREMEWAYGIKDDSVHCFNDASCIQLGGIDIDHTQVSVSKVDWARQAIEDRLAGYDTPTSSPSERVRRLLDSKRYFGDLGKKNRIDEIKRNNESLLRRISKNEQKTERDDSDRQYVIDLRKELADNERAITRMQAGTWGPIDLGLPDSAAYDEGGMFRAWVYRNGQLYEFFDHILSWTDLPKELSFEQIRQRFIDHVRAFRPRALYDVPRERGICVPYGFWPDDGTSDYTIGAQLRWTDAPNVIYRVRTGVIREGMLSPSTVIGSIGATGVGMAGLYGARTLETIGPRKTQIGELPALQGGMVLDTAPAGKPQQISYGVFTGREGWRDSQRLPYMVFEMGSYTVKQDPTLKGSVPPFKQSMERFEQFLKSVRLRPTEPPMPEESSEPGSAGR